MRIESLCEAVYEDLDGRVETVEVPDEEEVCVSFTCDDWEDPDRRRSFRLSCLGVRKHELSPIYVTEIGWLGDHPVLWTYTSEPCYLHFTTRPADGYSIVGRLYEAHERLYQGWGNLRDHLNRCCHPDLHALLRSGNGLLASGPRVVMEAYAAAVRDLLSVRITVGHHVHYEPGGKLRALVFDDRYIVCQDVNVSESTGAS